MNALVLGVDPGSRVTGYGLVAAAGETLIHVDSGHISLPASLPHSQRLGRIFARLEELLHRHRPAAVAVEEVFVAHNPQSALKLGQVRGVVLLAAARGELPVFEYSPLALKKALVGYGQATKAQMQLMVEQLLGRPVANHNAADALALAICHLLHGRFQDRLTAAAAP